LILLFIPENKIDALFPISGLDTVNHEGTLLKVRTLLVNY